MTKLLNAGLLEAMRLTTTGRLTDATAALQRMLGGSAATHEAKPAAAAQSVRPTPPTLDAVAEPAEAVHARTAPLADRLRVGLAAGSPPTWPDALRGLLDEAGHRGLQRSAGGRGGLPPATAVGRAPDGARFLTASFSNQAGTRPYKFYVPSFYHPGRPVPLIVMLHGCTQSPDDFATGTRMNEAAEKHTCLVAYPGQTTSANMQKCWNWFSKTDQHRGKGEPSLIEGIMRQVMRDFTVDPQRIYVAGLSAGGAAAAIMGNAYPDLFAAIGVHSGLACGAASDMRSAVAAMQGGGAVTPATSRSRANPRIMPTIVFHGDRDGTVNPRNADAVVAQSAQATMLRTHAEHGAVFGGHAYTRTLSLDAAGQPVIEQWAVHGAGHAWFGGNAAGSYTDPRGPDATAEMVRFFLEHPHPAPGLVA